MMTKQQQRQCRAATREAIRSAGGQAALAKRLGIHRSSVSRWEADGRVPTERAATVAQISGVPLERLRPDLFLART